MRHKKDTHKWHTRYMELAKLVGTWSKHPEHRVGAVAVGNYGQILSTGYNGWPRGIVDEEDGRAKTNRRGFSLSIHAEANLIYNTNIIGTSLKGATVYVAPMFPCLECAKALIQVGICQVVWETKLEACDHTWRISSERAGELFKEAGVNVTQLHV